MKITALVENTSCRDDILSEHGLSLFIETDSSRILFDMGQSDLFYKNSEKLNVNLAGVDLAVISHGHYDHGGGLKHFLNINSKAPVYINDKAFGDYYNGTEKYIGLDKTVSENKRVLKISGYKDIDNNLSIYSSCDFTADYPVNSGGLTKKTGNKFADDDFQHEQYLLIRENNKKILISGCSHKGILNIADWFDVDMIVGGFHFSKFALDDKLKNFAEILAKKDTVFITCHCTGVEQYEFMKQFMPKLYYLSAGQTIDTEALIKNKKIKGV